MLSALPAESLMEVLTFLDRQTLEAVALVCRRFSAVVQGDNSQLSLRHISAMTLTIDHGRHISAWLLSEQEASSSLQRTLYDAYLDLSGNVNNPPLCITPANS